MYLKFKDILVYLFYVSWKLALEKISVSTRNKTIISNTKAQKYCIFYQKQTSTQLMKNIFNDFALKKGKG